MKKNKEYLKKLRLDETVLSNKDMLAINFLANISTNLTAISQNENLNEKEKLKLLTFSILSYLDGCNGHLFKLIPQSLEKDGIIFKDSNNIAGNLHELFYSIHEELESRI